MRRLDVVWYCYIADSLKLETRSKRGKGIRRRVKPQSAVPGNWQEFCVSMATRWSFFSGFNVAEIETDKHLITTLGNDVLSSNQEDVSTLVPRMHEEGDTHTFLHLKGAVRH